MKFCVVGAGAWGTAFAVHLARLGRPVVLVPRRPEQAAALFATRENRDYLAGIALPESLVITADLSAALGASTVVLLACPSQALRETSARVLAARGTGTPLKLVVSLSKGLEVGSHLRPAQVIAAVQPDVPAGALTGPTNAAEVARGLPAAMVLGAGSDAQAWLADVQAALSGPTLRVYTSDDLAGVEYGGCLKNIYAIAAGCAAGLGLGDNANAALLTRALAEMVRVGSALGAWSRNREFGQRIGEGRSAAELIAHRKTVVEGYRTTESFHGLCVERKIDAPILREMHAILFEGKAPALALHTLMLRGLKRE
jgi:glycerol-3-phosphate dehydrogenase (NAD(P)+)